MRIGAHTARYTDLPGNLAGQTAARNDPNSGELPKHSLFRRPRAWAKRDPLDLGGKR
jgi:hypothetical protein